MFRYLGEDRYVYTEVTSELGLDFSIESSTYNVYNVADETIVASGIANVSGNIVYAQWDPTEAGLFAVDFMYIVGDEHYTSRQVIEVRETM